MKTDTNETGDFCPILKKTCIERECKLYIKLIGTNPQTDTPIDHWDCAIVWLPILSIENTQKTIQATASIDKLNNTIFDLSSPEAKARLIRVK